MNGCRLVVKGRFLSMSKPIKVRVRKFLKELTCLHKDFTAKTRMTGMQEFLICECNKCGKVWVE